MRRWQAERRADEVVEAEAVGHLEADVGAVERRRALHLRHLVEVATNQRNHLSVGRKGTGGKEEREQVRMGFLLRDDEAPLDDSCSRSAVCCFRVASVFLKGAVR